MTELSTLVPLVALFIFGTILVLCGLLLIAMGWNTLRLRIGQSEWMRSPAKIIDSKVEKRVFDESNVYVPKITYSFMYAAKTIEATRIRLVEKMYATEKGALRKLEQYPVGKEVVVGFPPGKPDEVVLEPGGGIAGLVLFLMGLAMALSPLLLWAYVQDTIFPVWIAFGLLSGMYVVSLANHRRNEKTDREFETLLNSEENIEDVVKKLLARGEKLQAIRLYRKVNATGLKEAKDAVENISRTT